MQRLRERGEVRRQFGDALQAKYYPEKEVGGEDIIRGSPRWKRTRAPARGRRGPAGMEALRTSGCRRRGWTIYRENVRVSVGEERRQCDADRFSESRLAEVNMRRRQMAAPVVFRDIFANGEIGNGR